MRSKRIWSLGTALLLATLAAAAQTPSASPAGAGAATGQRQPPAAAAGRVPNPVDVERQMRSIQDQRIPAPQGRPGITAADEARLKELASARTAPITMPDGVVIPQRQGPAVTSDEIVDAGGNPEDLAKLYSQLERGETHGDAWPVMIFASLSMPEASLRALAQASGRSGVPLVFRGLRYGMKQGALQRGLQALKPYITAGANVQLHPELFEYYGVATVPTVVVTGRPKMGCTDDRCAADYVRLTGDVTLDYALEQVSGRRDDLGTEARKVLARLRR